MTFPKKTKILILGLGSYPQGTGVSAALYFAKRGNEIVVADQKTAKEVAANVKQLKKFKKVAFHLGGWRVEDADWADLIIKNPGVRRSNDVLKHAQKLGKRIENDISIFLREAPCLTVGVTGTRGKTTTTAWIGDMLKRSGIKTFVGGNITVSPLTFLDKLKKKDVAVIELSSWLLETTGVNGLSPDIAVWTNVMNDHLNTYDGLYDYAEAKAQIMRHQKPNGIFIANLDDEYVRSYAGESAAKVLGFSKNKKQSSTAFIQGGWLTVSHKGKKLKLLPTTDVGLKGEHNVMNALAASIASLSAGAKVSAVRESLGLFKGMPYRQEIVGHKNGVIFVDDTTSTTPDAAIAALEAFARGKGTVHWICGGADKGLDYAKMIKTAKGKKITIHLLVGTAFDRLQKAFKSKGLKPIKSTSLKQAFDRAVKQAKPGDVVLLSPACASFGLFKNEFDRGDQFNRLVAGFIRAGKMRA
ncbi:MAG: UDP-N-acetylmuramoyl-L-alanine--D-glutamate ligase [Patescibacteria group bacterium]|nr:UDP-N-acetylmuramoyl-L-alanine--D-glutamate ligase [Patescibacteria group bacterium]